MNGQALWSSHTNDGVILYYQGDGNLVLYSSQTAVWSSNTVGTHQHGRVEMRNDGYFVILDDMFNEVWNCQEWQAYSTVQTVPYHMYIYYTQIRIKRIILFLYKKQ
eukprot:550607_1